MELNIGIICASLPTLRAFLAEFFPNAFASSIPGAHQDYSNQSGQRQLMDQNSSESAGVVVIKNEASEVDVEKARGTFLASDSEAETPGLAPPEMSQRLA